ncbi:hypothetical protein [Sulfurimonas sp. HSL-1716]|uniref:hypothetical protein n=1 Tax=Hydrocurvibacter sulfurireducens TaxID=3131937 RepID=UPI0031F75B3C
MRKNVLEIIFMNESTRELFTSRSAEEILTALDTTLKSRNESPFWMDKVVPFSKAILSVLIPLREQDLLFNPEGRYQDSLSAELFLEWMDFVSLKMLAFTLQASNDASKLLRTSLDDAKCLTYEPIDLETLAAYLTRYNVNLENEALDFPIANYNVHQGVKNVIKSLL